MGTLLERIGVILHLQRLWTNIVARHQGKRKQQLVLDQSDQVERPCERQHIVLAIRIDRSSLILAGDKLETSTRMQLRFYRLQAALTHQGQPSPTLEMEPDLRLGAALCSHFSSGPPVHQFIRDGLRIGMGLVAQAIQQDQGAGAGLVTALLRKGSDIHAARIELTDLHAAILGCRLLQRRMQRPMGQSAPMQTTPPLILGSTSIYRRELLARLRIPFQVVAPNVDEAARVAELPEHLATRLAMSKARAVAQLHPDSVVIGSDQVAELDGVAVGKPGSHRYATEQLRAMSGRQVIFHTAVAVVCSARGFEESDLARVSVKFRSLTHDEIERYLQAEQPYDCAGSAKSEALGIALLQAVESDDPTALIGLPLIRTCSLLRRAGLDPLGTVDRSVGR